VQHGQLSSRALSKFAFIMLRLLERRITPSASICPCATCCRCSKSTGGPGVIRHFRATGTIGIDPFFYFEGLAYQPGAPALVYDWKVEKIEVQTAPFIEVAPRMMAPDPAQLGWKEIVETNAREDAGEYLLHCSRLDGPRPPKGKRHP
jgi:hypothetical protein